ncbi:WD40 repeat domain-containing protein, partial [Streptomyces sp. NPDC057621]|uniref:WD40 repeat domain-containing protein n=1 Tax=Streptomyces sp. NPDC057621 TaxID=3346186 RepID=UPI00369F7018
LVNRLPGWTEPERLVALLEERLPDVPSVRVPGGAGPPGTLRLPHGCTAVGWHQGGDTVQLAGGGSDGSVRVWRLWSPEPVAAQPLHQGRVTAVDLADDGRSVVTGGKDGAVRLWSFGGSGRERVLTWHQGWVDDVRIRADLVFSLGDDGQIRRSAPFGEPGGRAAPTVFPLRITWSAAGRLAVTSDARTLVAGGSDRATVWDAGTGGQVDSVATGCAVTALALDADDRLLAIGCADGGIHVHDLRERTVLYRWPGRGSPLRALSFGPGGILAAADETGHIRVRDAAAGETRDRAVGVHPRPTRSLAFNRLGELLSADGDGLVRAWPLSPGN